MKIPLYYIWGDTMFYAYAAVFAAALAGLVYAIRRWLELKNSLPYEEEFMSAEELSAPAEELVPTPMAEVELPPQEDTAPEAGPQGYADPEKTVVVANVEELVAQATLEAAQAIVYDSAPAAAPALPAAHENARAEEFVKGIYEHIAGIEARMGAIEESIAKGGGNRHFTVKFLEGILEDYDTLSVGKIKARVEYLVSDLKENPAGKN